MNHLRIVPVTTLEQVAALTVEANKDKHNPAWPSHLLMRGDKIVGYLSLNLPPTCHAWLHTSEVSARDTFTTVFPAVENMLRMLGHKEMIYLTGNESNLTPFAHKIGFTHVGSTNIFHKNLNT